MINHEQSNNQSEDNSLTEAEKVLGTLPKNLENYHSQGEEEKSNEVGEAYAEIAKNALIKWNGLSEKEATEKVAASSLDELESIVGAKGSIEAATRSIADRLQLDNNRLDEAVLYGRNADIFKEAEEKIKSQNFNDEFIDDGDESNNNIEKFILDILSDVHDNWCAENETKFFDEKRSDKKYQFLKLELIGFDEATSDLLFVEPILRQMGVKFDIDESEEQYDNLEEQYDNYPEPIGEDSNAAHDFYTYNQDDVPEGGDFAENLYDDPSIYLSKGASDKIKDAIHQDFGIAAEITMQVGKHRTEDTDYGSLVAYHEGGEEGVIEYWHGGDKNSSSQKNVSEDDSEFNSDEYINDGWN